MPDAWPSSRGPWTTFAPAPTHPALPRNRPRDTAEPGAAWVEERTRVAVGRNVNVWAGWCSASRSESRAIFRGEVSSGGVGGDFRSERRSRPQFAAAAACWLWANCGAISPTRANRAGPERAGLRRIETDSLPVCEGATARRRRAGAMRRRGFALTRARNGP